ncbi:zinc transport system substrate-binding protein [Marinactinospora thermotolerans DSM 45154]|uniref:Zinc transport system substrate-binding protein n=2 Tax=Marinactinospora thermotolerans TaxID=531310 RepID=A0A1T4RR07_9ACTN|nr:zinc transport system substrate-binding protein [Marinactinospora thermotolerans DSM 45154]
MMTKVAAAGAAGLVAVAAAGCGGATEEADGVSVVTGVYPLEWLASQVGGEAVTVTNLTEPGAEPHDLELSPRQIGVISDADVALYIQGMQPAVDDAVAQQAADSALDVAQVVELREVPSADGGGTDPHMWLDPQRMAEVAGSLGERLAEIDPDGAAAYRANAQRVADELGTLEAEYTERLDDCETRNFVVSHAAFGYLADKYDLNQIGITGIEPDSEPSPARMAEVAETVREQGVTTIFTETLVSPAVAETVAEETGARTAVLDPLEGITDASPGDDYPSVMRANLDTLAEALSCS